MLITRGELMPDQHTEVHPELTGQHFAYVSVSRTSHDAHIFTNDATSLPGKLSQDVRKNTAVSFGNAQRNSMRQGCALRSDRLATE